MTPPRGASLAARHGVPGIKPKDMRGTLRRLWEMTEGHRQGLGLILLLSALASASTILSPLLIGSAVNRIDAGHFALWIFGLLLLLYGTDWLVRFLQQFLHGVHRTADHPAHPRVLFSAMKKLPLSFFDKRQHGELMSRLTNDVDNISTTLSDSLSQLMVYVFTILGVFGIMLS